MIERVKEKLEKEMAVKASDKYVKVILSAVYDALIFFCEQNEEFCQAVLDSNKTILDCCSYCIVPSVRELCGAKAIDIYNRMVDFYFSGASVEFSVTLNLSADAEKAPLGSYRKKAVVLNLFDVL